MRDLLQAGLTLVYVGAESGDDTVLQRVNKGETFATTSDALDKLGAAGITRSVMLLNGLGGRVLTQQHALQSARLANATQPEFLASLVVSFPQGEARFRQGFSEWEPLDPQELFREIEHHASNWLVLKGTLGAEKPRLLAEVRTAIDRPQAAALRSAWARGI